MNSWDTKNLLVETKKAIKGSGHSIKDIIFIGSQKTGYECTWEQFKTLADKNYDCGFGGDVVSSDLIVVFSDGQKMWRGEYDGSEWWEYSTPFIKPKIRKRITDLFVGYRKFKEDNQGV